MEFNNNYYYILNGALKSDGKHGMSFPDVDKESLVYYIRKAKYIGITSLGIGFEEVDVPNNRPYQNGGTKWYFKETNIPYRLFESYDSAFKHILISSFKDGYNLTDHYMTYVNHYANKHPEEFI